MKLVEGTSLIEPFSVQFDLDRGLLLDTTTTTVRRASDMRGYYEDESALETLISDSDDPIHYEVFEHPVPHEPGHLMYCISKLQPGRVGAEFFMTKGHYHTVSNTAEFYLCLRGNGHMLLKTPDGDVRAEEFKPGRMVYAPPYWAHRSVNTGDGPLISLCVYPANAGHNYGDIQREGFIKRVRLRDGTPTIS